MAHNKAHGITPKSVQKALSNILETIYGADPARAMQAKAFADAELMGLHEDQAEFITPDAVKKRIVVIEKQMHKAAGDLEFEEAARLRDELKKLEALELGLKK